jgi:hypothetical protein
LNCDPIEPLFMDSPSIGWDSWTWVHRFTHISATHLSTLHRAVSRASAHTHSKGTAGDQGQNHTACNNCLLHPSSFSCVHF